MSAKIVNNITVNLVKDGGGRSESIHSEKGREVSCKKQGSQYVKSSNNSQYLSRKTPNKQKEAPNSKKFGLKSDYNLRAPSPMGKKFVPNMPTRKILQMFRNNRKLHLLSQDEFWSQYSRERKNR